MRRKTAFQEEATAGPRLRSQLGKEKTREEAAAKCGMGERAWSAGGGVTLGRAGSLATGSCHDSHTRDGTGSESPTEA